MFSKKIGNEYENKFMKLLVANGWWCHLFAYKVEGQPCDVIGIKNDTPVLVDVKHCNKDVFPFSYIRPNQKSCFSLAYQKGNHNCGFAIFFEQQQQWRLLPYSKVLENEKKGKKSQSFNELYTLEEYGIINKE